ncbi:MAG: winged helix-turn-helix domain-containing protein, partial [Woeseiaceae bacterium]|nr:winged helix-turn-helix domain-containing protein [Woeseiaceae bacterium]
MGTPQDFMLGPHTVRPSRACIERDGNDIHVKPKSMAVLVQLAAANGDVVTRNRLFDSVWPNCDVSDDVLTHSIVELRKALGDSARDPRFIETIPKSGFRLVAPVSPCSEQPVLAPRRRLPLRPASLVAVIAFLGIAALLSFRGPGGDNPADANAARVPSVAVLPFVDLSENQDQGYFVDGLSEEMINRLTRIDGLQVTGRTSSFYFKGRNEDLRSIGARLGVGHILEGSVRRSGDRLRVTAQLVDLRDGFHVWSDTFDRNPADIFQIQDDIAEAVARALSIRLSVGDLGTLEGGTRNVDAFEAVLQGNALALEFDAASVLRSIELYRRAVELDPEFGLAWERLANIYRNAWLVLGRDEYEHWAELADEAIAEALRIAPTSPHVLTTAAYMHADRQQWPEALGVLDRVAEVESSKYVAAT